MRVFSVAMCLVFGAQALRAGPTKSAPLQKAPVVTKMSKEVAHKPTETDVEQLHAKLEKLAGSLSAMIHDTNGPLMKAKIGPEMEMFVKELNSVLTETKSIKDPVVAFQKLEAARASMGALTSELTHRQEDLMMEGEAQKESLLLGVLMTKQKEPLAQQLQILHSDDFKDLEVSKFLLKSTSTSPLNVQAAAYMDTHQSKATAKMVMDDAAIHAKAQARADALASSFEKRVESLEKVHASKEKEHNKRMKELEDGIKKAGKKSKHVMEALKKREERSYKKWNAMQKHDIDSMKAAVMAIKTNDMKALEKAKGALEESIKNLKSKNGGFLVLLEVGHTFMEQDCPYCAAQCVDKCHTEGKPYMTCLTDCADAGKGK